MIFTPTYCRGLFVPSILERDLPDFLSKKRFTDDQKTARRMLYFMRVFMVRCVINKCGWVLDKVSNLCDHFLPLPPSLSTISCPKILDFIIDVFLYCFCLVRILFARSFFFLSILILYSLSFRKLHYSLG